MTCQEYEILLEKELAGNLTEEEQAEMEKHDSECAACRALHESMKDLDEKIEAQMGKVPPLPDGLHDAWMKKIEEEPFMEKNEKKRSWNWMRYVGVAAAVLFVVVGTIMTRDTLPARTSKSVVSEEAGCPYLMSRSVPAYGDSNAMIEDMEAEMAYASEDSMDTGNVYGGVAEAKMAENSIPEEKKIIRTASLTIMTKSFDESLDALTALCKELNGWVSWMSVSTGSGNLQRASMTLRIPQENLDAFLSGSGEYGRVTSREETADDVTESYRDTQTRLATQQALMERLQSLVTTAAKLSDLLELESQIADTQYTIDSLQQSLKSTDRKVSYSTVSINLREERKEDTVVSNVTFGERILAAFQMGLESFTEWLQDMVLFLIASIPFILIAVVIFVIIHVVRKKMKKQR